MANPQANGPPQSEQALGKGRNAKIDWEVLSKRIGHPDVAFTMKQ